MSVSKRNKSFNSLVLKSSKLHDYLLSTNKLRYEQRGISTFVLSFILTRKLLNRGCPMANRI